AESHAAFIHFWRSFAAHLAGYDANRVFLELLNEPVFANDGQSWQSLQGELIRAVRKQLPTHTIIATGPERSTVHGLTQLTPYPDPNVIYAFHYYEPFAFTHQGASWITDPAGLAQIAGLQYPYDPANCDSLQKAPPSPGA